MMTTIQRIQEWYARQCNGDWEHSYGVKIDTLDNPGWWVKIELTGTDLEGKTFEAIQKGLQENGHPSEKEWICCSVKGNLFDGAGDSSKLEMILQTFLDWMDKNANQAMHPQPVQESRSPWTGGCW